MGSEQNTLTEEFALQQTLDRKRAQLKDVAQTPSSKSWLYPCTQSEAGTDQLLQELEHRVTREDFAQVLLEEKHRQDAASNTSLNSPGNEVLDPEWWQAVPSPLGNSQVNEATGEYVVVEHSDVVDALASFIAAYIVALPASHSMEPKQLQKAVQESIKEIRKGRIRKIWDWGRFLYRTAALSYGAFAAYTNPWVAEAVLKALFTAVRFARMFW